MERDEKIKFILDTILSSNDDLDDVFSLCVKLKVIDKIVSIFSNALMKINSQKMKVRNKK